MKERRAFVLGTVALFAVCGLGLLRAKAQTGGAPPAAPNSAPIKKAEEQFKNIQVLKGIPADQLIPSMQFITASLGVECEFCHVQGAFEKDDKKPKQTARKMIEMMFTINAENFEGHREVTCYSCHRGSTKPVATPIISTEEPKEPSSEVKKDAGNKAEEPSADQLFDKYLQAIGGAAAVDKITSRVMKGTIDFGGQLLAVDLYSKQNERASFMHMLEGESVTAFDGHEGWLSLPGHPVREMHGPDLDGAAIDADLHLAAHLKQMFNEVQVQGTEKIGEHEAYVIVGQREAKTPLQLYFDERSGLLLRMVRYGETVLGQIPTQVDYADYRDANGVKLPFRWTLSRPNGRFTIQVSDLKQNVPVDDSTFAKPADPAEPQKAPRK
jgi:photosynthetic reaction center cytochrome c subunit